MAKKVKRVETEQIVYDTADTIDRPGQSAGGTIIVRKGETLESASRRRDLEKSNGESDRVNAAQKAAMKRKLLEQAGTEEV